MERRCGEGTGFSSEIETPWLEARRAGRKRGEGTGFSSEIETMRKGGDVQALTMWRGNWLLI